MRYRRRRSNRTPEQERLYEVLDRKEFQVQVMARGLGEMMQYVDDSATYAHAQSVMVFLAAGILEAENARDAVNASWSETPKVKRAAKKPTEAKKK